MAHLGKILFAVILMGIGIAAGFTLATAPASVGHQHRPTPDGMCSCEADALVPCEAPGRPEVLPPQTLENLGVEIAPVRRVPLFERTHPVQAVVVDRPLNRRPVVAPFGGIVTGLYVRTGAVVAAGAELATVARDPIPRPKPELTAGLLAPVAEAVHEAVRTLRTEISQLEVVRRELDRIRPFVENRTIPRKTAIDLEYQAVRHEQAAGMARADLLHHGLTPDEVKDAETGNVPHGAVHLWRRVLKHNGLWSEQGEAILAALPQGHRELPWTVAAVGELSASGLATEALALLLREHPAAARHFAEVAGLLLQGTPLATVRLLIEKGALEPRMSIRAPASGGDEPDDWDVEAILVRPGQRVESGQVLVVLYDARRMWLRLQPVGQELQYVADAIERGLPLHARPLVPGSGPALDDVELMRMAVQADEADRGGLAYALVQNVSFACVAHSACRTWQLRKGLRYLVEVPIERYENHFVLPAAAITAEGPNTIVFVREGDTFRSQPVHVKHLDDRVAVIADDGAIFDGDPVVQRGAFPLGLALQRGGAGSAANAHGHSHH